MVQGVFHWIDKVTPDVVDSGRELCYVEIRRKGVGIVIMQRPVHRAIPIMLTLMLLVSLTADASACRCAWNLSVSTQLDTQPEDSPSCCCAASAASAACHGKPTPHSSDDGCSGKCGSGACPCCARGSAPDSALPPGALRTSNPDGPVLVLAAAPSALLLPAHAQPLKEAAFPVFSSRPYHLLHCALLR